MNSKIIRITKINSYQALNGKRVFLISFFEKGMKFFIHRKIKRGNAEIVLVVCEIRVVIKSH